MPKSLEAYYQEAGRAGRDGSRADCILLYSPGDVRTAEFLINNAATDTSDLTPAQQAQHLAQERKRLHAMVSYCNTTTCLRSAILDYFGQRHGDRCDNCSACLARFRMRDITREAQMILSCARRAENRLGRPCEAGLLADVLHGSDKAEVTDPGLDQLTTYGLMRDVSMAQLMDYLSQLTQQAFLMERDGGLTLTSKADPVLFDGAAVRISIAALPGQSPAKRSDASLSEEDAALYAQLQTLRRTLAERESVPAYVIFSNATLTELAKRRPTTRSELLDISGIGASKARRYGDAILEAIAQLTSD
jgi:ATP-dependent DNA helicase RecQ